MPIFLEGGQYIVRCINQHLPSHYGADGQPRVTTRAETHWNTLLGAEPAVPPAAPGYPGHPPRLNFGRGQPVRSYTCVVCGYVEMYDAQVIDPVTWAEV